MKDKPLFGDIIAKEIYGRNISLNKFGNIVGISGHSIITYANNKRIPRADLFLRICDELNIDPNSVKFKTKED